ncbi:hypothetical protein QC761_504990 [Podospora bellae-mahoneyi]|uniref:Uncharacterized protein n=1 Tax=Podospora bellae-mahoneyi TaxID=2093777 RepID=A0ABR0FF40_9PEZI|nr:hypothetical protein QC761_504990 [Podospora bellae-mahoneyi]
MPRAADVAFWSLCLNGWRDNGTAGDEAEVVVGAAAGQAAAVVVMRVVLWPEADVVVVRIPAEGFFLSVGGCVAVVVDSRGSAGGCEGGIGGGGIAFDSLWRISKAAISQNSVRKSINRSHGGPISRK